MAATLHLGHLCLQQRAALATLGPQIAVHINFLGVNADQRRLRSALFCSERGRGGS